MRKLIEGQWIHRESDTILQLAEKYLEDLAARGSDVEKDEETFAYLCERARKGADKSIAFEYKKGKEVYLVNVGGELTLSKEKPE